MFIEVASTAGFCFGVDRAVKMLEKTAAEQSKVFTLGPIIHNPQVIDEFAAKGIKIIDSPDEAHEGDCVVIRAHGVSEEVRQKLIEKKVVVVDATCPYVTKIHNLVKKHTDKDTVLIIAGNEKHPEVIGFRSCCCGRSYVFDNIDSLKAFFDEHPGIKDERIVSVAQTTFSAGMWDFFKKYLKKVCTNYTFYDTICRATGDRQNEASIMSKRCDAMIVVGGRSSSNTEKLRKICEANCPTFAVEDPKELDAVDFSGYRHIGLTAGASTPARVIKEVHKHVGNLERTNK